MHSRSGWCLESPVDYDIKAPSACFDVAYVARRVCSGVADLELVRGCGALVEEAPCGARLLRQHVLFGRQRAQLPLARGQPVLQIRPTHIHPSAHPLLLPATTHLTRFAHGLLHSLKFCSLLITDAQSLR